jgi:hypothetical protein
MPVTDVHPLYTENLPLWELIRDSVNGEAAIKAQRVRYLPKASGASDEDYESYLTRTHYTMFTARTLEGLYGQVFSNPPEREGDTPELLQKLLDNVTKDGTTADQFASDLVYDVNQTHWGGTLVDHSPVPEGTTEAEKEKLGLTSFLRRYAAENITNWRYGTVNDRQELCLVVLKEDYSVVAGDIFSPVSKTRYRVLKLADGIYVQEVWEQVKNNKTQKDEWQVTETYIPQLDGKPLDFIPFFTCPAKEPEKSMLLPIAYLNIGHYQLTADYVNVLHFTGTPTAYAIGVDPPVDGKGNPVPVKIGGNQVMFLKKNGDGNAMVSYLEPSGSSPVQLLASIENIKKDIEAMGSDLIKAKKKGIETAEAARIHQSGENAVLGSFTLNMSEILTKALRLAARWRGVPENITEKFNYVLNMDYEGDLTRIDEKNLGMRMVDSGVMSTQRFLKEVENMTDTEMKAELVAINGEGKTVELETEEQE